jgi:hypothetical protein
LYLLSTTCLFLSILFLKVKNLWNGKLLDVNFLGILLNLFFWQNHVCIFVSLDICSKNCAKFLNKYKIFLMIMKYDIEVSQSLIIYLQSLSWAVLNLVLMSTSTTIKSMSSHAGCFNYVTSTHHSRKNYQRKMKLQPWIAESDSRMGL